jgi:hypothetical protein
MKNKLSKIWGVSLVVMLLVSMLAVASPVSADDNEWETETIPSATGYVLLNGSDVTDIAISGDTIYAVTGGDYVYKSTNGGETWTQHPSTTLDTAVHGSFDAHLIAVAPDNPDVVAVVDTSQPLVAVTTTGGAKWASLGTIVNNVGATKYTAGTINDVAVSATERDINQVAVAGSDNSTNGMANIWSFNLGGAVTQWSQLGFPSSSAFSVTTDYSTVAAIEFSPAFASDQVLVALVEDDDNSTGNDVINLEMYSFSGKNWNETGAGFIGYPVNIVTDVGITGIDSASLSLDPGYIASDDVSRVSFIGLDITGGTTATAYNGIWRSKDITVKAVHQAAANQVKSVAYDGTNLVAGADDSNIVWRCADPLATSPTVQAASGLKRPSGATDTVVLWSGANVVAGTSGDDSAFAVSTDNGKTFNDLSLVDSTIVTVNDVAVAADGSVVYMVTDDGVDLSVWRQASAWTRILNIQSDTGYLARVAPDDSDVLYVLKKNGTKIYYTSDAGATKWSPRTVAGGAGTDLADMAVESADVAYAIQSNGSVIKSTNAGFTWGRASVTDLSAGGTIVVVDTNTLLATSTDGYVAYSTDGNASWTDITKQVTTSGGTIQVVADADFANNNIIYAATSAGGGEVWKWEVGQAMTEKWVDIFNDGGPAPAIGDDFRTNEGVYGMAIEGGVLYVLTYDTDTTMSYLWQCLEPTKSTKSAPPGSWNAVATDAGISLNNSPKAMKVSTGSVKIWAPDGANLYSLVDALGTETPVLVAPAEGLSNPVNPVTGKANELVFSWDRISNATDYVLKITYDAAGKEQVTRIAVSSEKPLVTQAVGPDQTGDARVNWMPGTTYYWTVQASEPLNSQKSETRSLSTQPGAALVPEVLSPANGASAISDTPAFSWSPVSGATLYEWQLASLPTEESFASPVDTAEIAGTAVVPTDTLADGQYFWRVRAIEPVLGDWSAISNFTVAAAAAAPGEDIVINVPEIVIPEQEPPIINLPPTTTEPAVTPGYIWAIIIIGAVLVIAIIVLIVRTRRTV